jgi:hypothetical protein
MNTSGTITADTTSQTPLDFAEGHQYNPGGGYCPADTAANQGTGPQGCKTNPFVVDATLNVATGTAHDKTGVLTVSNTGSPGLAADATPDTGNVKVDAAGPTISLTMPGEDDSFDVDESVTVDYSCSDTGSGVKDDTNTSAIEGCVGDQADGATLDTSTPGSYTFTVNAEDNFGNTSSVTHNYTVVNPDNTGPVITPHVTGTQGANDWYTSDVSVSWTVSDPESTITSKSAACDTTTTINSDTTGQTVSCSATSAGGTTNQSVTIKRDATQPSVTVSLAHSADHNTWYNAPVGYGVSARSDDTSGIDSCQADATYSGPDSQNASVSRECTDLAGNTGTGSATFKYDDTNSALAPTVDPNPVQLMGSATVKANASDSTSNVDQASVSCGSVDANTVTAPNSNRSVSCSAADNAGNTNTASATYTVVFGSGFGGFLQPINTDGSSRFKLGSTIPVKFQLKDATGALVTGDQIAQLAVNQSDTKPDAGVDEAISTAASTTGNWFRYDATSGQHIFNLSTKSGYTTPDPNNPGQIKTVQFSQGTWTLWILLKDGTSRSVKVQLVR